MFTHKLFNLRCRSLMRKYASQTSAAASSVRLENEKLQKYLENLRGEYYALRVNTAGNSHAYARMARLEGVVNALERQRALERNLTSKHDLDKETDEDMRKLMEEENEVYTDLIRKQEEVILQELLLLADDENYPAVIFEVNAGAGGQEAMLFAKELYEMYTNYFEHMGWDFEEYAYETTDIGGLRHANIMVNDSQAYMWLCNEAGVHRVQRVPATEKSGRMHTSTASITVIPRPADFQINIAEKDLKIETKRASGAGGQHVNTTDSAVRIVHLPTGLAVESQSERSQLKNRELALKRLQAKLLQQQLQSAESSKQATRKAQQGSLNRNEKIRTYNYVQDRVTDHRIQGGTLHNISGFLEGGDQLSRLIERLQLEQRKVKLASLIEMWQPPSDVNN
ncbi:peptide chain release factor 1-like, mitochondrial [Scaptodrosophila lebanonensis]|uniref:Peptide chain release factor 1-like, mitochondrial n=1 Tax=Drosophila lebanonensis TaxID=7225 RepID=A0A6J2TQS0_DROLE|nr:peptide chain release factor 1-like, mitochondrial [Scaptodrosophila lebanonensis]